MDLAVSSYPQTYERTPGIARPTKDVWTPHPSPANEEATSCGRAFVISGHTRFTHELRGDPRIAGCRLLGDTRMTKRHAANSLPAHRRPSEALVLGCEVHLALRK